MNPKVDREQFLETFGLIQHHVSRCIRCGFCNTACPTSNVKSAFKDSRTSRGRLILLQSLIENVGKLNPYSSHFKNLIDLCYSCRRCVLVCPAGIPIPDLMSSARYAYLQRKGPVALTLGHRIFANYGTWDRLGSVTAPFSSWMLKWGFFRCLMAYATHIDSRAHLPPFSRQSFESWFRKQPQAFPSPKKIVYFIDSYANYNNPSLAKTVVALLSHLGYHVVLPPQKQSGMPAIEFGLLDKAREIAHYNLKQLLPYAREGVRIVCSSPAATYLLKEGYQTILNDPDADKVSQAVVDIGELLLEEYENGTLTFSSNPPEQVQYHYCCLAKTLSLGPTTTKLLRAAGLEYRQVEGCCGGAGVWGTFKENYQVSSEIAQKLQRKIEPRNTILTESETCKLQMEAHTGATVLFPIELLSRRVSGLHALNT